MKKVLTFLSLVAFFALTAINVNAQEMKFEQEVIDYGTITKGADGQRYFEFTNTGNAPLTISNAKGSCGCTVPTYPKEPIMPGEKAQIKVKYDTKRVGPFTKKVYLTTNDVKKTKHTLTIKGTVKAAPAATPQRKSLMKSKH